MKMLNGLEYVGLVCDLFELGFNSTFGSVSIFVYFFYRLRKSE